MNAITRHELIGIDTRGELCACGDQSRYWADHLYVISLEALGEEPATITRVRDAIALERALAGGLPLVVEAAQKRRRCPAECPIIVELRRVRRNERRRHRNAVRYRTDRGITAA